MQPHDRIVITGTGTALDGRAGEVVFQTTDTRRLAVLTDGLGLTAVLAQNIMAETPVPPPPLPPVRPAPESPFSVGVVSGAAILWELPFIQALRARTARIEVAIGTSVANLTPIIEAYARAGIRPLLMAGFHQRLPSDAEARNLATWAAAFGPGGTFWRGKNYPTSVEVTDFEFGNETSYSYQFSDNSTGAYTARATTYGQRFVAAATAMKAANPNVGLLAIADGMNPKAWVAGMVKGAPTLDSLAAGFTCHPYGNTWQSKLDGTIGALTAAGIRNLVDRLWLTEWGLSSDNGRTLSDNYGYKPNMTYKEASDTLLAFLRKLAEGYAGAVKWLGLYQAHDLYPSGTRTGREAYFGGQQRNGAPKGEYTTTVMGALAGSLVGVG